MLIQVTVKSLLPVEVSQMYWQRKGFVIGLGLLICSLGLFVPWQPTASTALTPLTAPLHHYQPEMIRQLPPLLQSSLEQLPRQGREKGLQAAALDNWLLKTRCQLENDFFASHLISLHRQAFFEVSGAVNQQQILDASSLDFLIAQQILLRVASLIRELKPSESRALSQAFQRFLIGVDETQLSARQVQLWLEQTLPAEAAAINQAVRISLTLYTQYNADQQQAYLSQGLEAPRFRISQLPALKQELVQTLTWVEENYLWLHQHWGASEAGLAHSKLGRTYFAMTLKQNR